MTVDRPLTPKTALRGSRTAFCKGMQENARLVGAPHCTCRSGVGAQLTLEPLEARRLLTELITNGSFAANSAGWTVAGDFRADAAFTNGNTLPGYAYLAAANGALASSNNLAGSIRQSVTLPSDLSQAELTFWFKHSTQETAGTNDVLNVVIRDAANGVIQTLITQANQTNASYTQLSFDLLDYAGQTITVSFEGQTNSTLGTVFRIDDVSLDVIAAGALIAPTPVSPGIINTTGLPTVNTPVPTVRWQPTSGAAGYGVMISRLGINGYTTVYNTDTTQPYPTPIKGTTFTVPAALTAGTYRWQVRAFDNAGTPGSYSPPLYFTLATSGYNRAVGIDISNFQTVTSWSNVKTNGTAGTTTDDTSFVYAKATEGFTFNDAKFVSHANGAASAGIPLGAYHFARPGNNSAASEAQHFYDVISTRLTAGNLIPMLDFEDGSASTIALGRTALSEWVNDFGDAFYALSGLVPIVYTFVSYATSYLNTSVIRYPLWMAQYPTASANPAIPLTSGAPSGTSPWPSGAWSMWQYTSNRTVAGFTANVDSNVANADVSTFYNMFKIPSSAKGSISGTLFADANENGTRDVGEAVLAGRSVYLDADNDGTRDPGELQAVTNANGLYTFTNVPEGAHRVRQIVPAGNNATGPIVHAFQMTAGQIVTGKDFGSIALDTTPPTLITQTYEYDRSPSPITLVFSEALQSAPSPTAFTLARVDDLATPIAFTLTYNAGTQTATLTPNSALANGDYRLVIASGAAIDAAGNANAASSFDFFVLVGDLNRDRAVNFDDLLSLAQHYGSSGSATYAQGDVNDDGAVDFDDLLALAQNYGQTLVMAQVAVVPAGKRRASTRAG